MRFMPAELVRHVREFQRYIRNHKWEASDQGIFFPEARVFARGLYEHRVIHKGIPGPWLADPNLLPTEGLNTMLDNLNGATGAALYMSLYAGAISPASTWTAANYTATASEITSGSEGYNEATRVLWDAAAASAAAKHNTASPAVFTIVTATSLTVNGCALHTVSTKGGTTGKLASATRFGSARSFANTDVFNIKYTISLTSS